MAHLHLHSQNWPASPEAGKLPSDPYYKLRRHAELAARAKAVSEAATAASNVQDRNRTMLEATSKPLEMFDRATRTVDRAFGTAGVSPLNERSADFHAAEPTQPPPPVDAPRELDARVAPAPIDQIVAGEQRESEAWLRRRVPAAATELELVAERLEDAGDAVAARQAGLLAQGLESVRRAINKLADELWPPESGLVADRAGRERLAHDRAYLARIDLAMQNAKSANGMYRLDLRETKLFHQRLSTLVSRIASGIHHDGDYWESRQLYVDSWRVVAACRRFLDPS